MTKTGERKKEPGVVVPLRADEKRPKLSDLVELDDSDTADKKKTPNILGVSEEQMKQAKREVVSKRKMMTFDEVKALSTSQLLDIMHRDTGVNERIVEDDFWKVILERKPFWFFDLTRTELGEYNNLHLEHHVEMEKNMNDKIDFLETVVRLLIEMIGDLEIKTDVKTVLNLAGFLELLD